jgi:predicted metal-dependent HD superfamily phosphohydrolase
MPNDVVAPSPERKTASDEQLRARFADLWRRSAGPGSDRDPASAWAIIDRAYAEPHRHYHDKQHLSHCLDELDMARGAIPHPDRVEMALWFHDVINEPGRPDNEVRSEDLFLGLASGVMSDDFVASVAELIRVTTHQHPPEDLDQRFICDIDLASFGCPWECYLHDTDKVKAEFPGSAEEYYDKKRAFLESMLRRPRIFLTDLFNARYEQQARENIRRLLDLIDQRAC